MSKINRLIPWVTQPQGANGIDKSHWLGSGHVLSINPAVGEVEGKVRPVYYGTATQTISRGNRTYYADDSANDAVAIPLPATHPLYAITTKCTLSIWIDVTSSADYCNYFSVPYRSAGWTAPYNALTVFKNTGDANKTVFQWSINSAGGESGAFTTEVVTTGYANYTFVRDGSSVSVYKNGALVETVSAAGNTTVDWGEKRPVVLLNSSESSLPNNGFVGHHHGLDVWNRPLSAGEIKRYFDNRWQLYAPRKRQIYVSAASSGTTLVSASDSLTPSFTESLALLSASAISDTATPSVTESVGLAVLVSATDAVTPGVTDTAEVIAAVITSDTLTPTLVEAQASFVSSALAEAFTLSLGETQGSLLSSAVTDIATISVSDTAAVLVAMVGSDTYIVSITDSAAVVTADTIAKAVTESFTLSLTEVASIVTASLWTDKAVAITVWTDKPDASTTWTVQ